MLVHRLRGKAPTTQRQVEQSYITEMDNKVGALDADVVGVLRFYSHTHQLLSDKHQRHVTSASVCSILWSI